MFVKIVEIHSVNKYNQTMQHVSSITILCAPSSSSVPTNSLLMGAHRHPNASVAGIWTISSLKGMVSFPGVVAIWADFEIFERLGGAGDNSYI